MAQQPRLIKKYPNRRLYDTESSAYITIEDVKKLVLDQVAFKVEDAKTHDDLTRSILLQIILEEESAQGAPMFSCDMLTNIIRFYGNTMQGMMGNYLDKNIQTFIEIQKRLQEQSQAIYGSAAPPAPNANAWAEFLKMQGPAMQGLMGNYLEQSANAFIEMQRQMQRHPGALDQHERSQRESQRMPAAFASKRTKVALWPITRQARVVSCAV